MITAFCYVILDNNNHQIMTRNNGDSVQPSFPHKKNTLLSLFKSKADNPESSKFLILMMVICLIQCNESVHYVNHQTLSEGTHINSAALNKNKSIIIAGTANSKVNIWRENNSYYSKSDEQLTSQGSIHSVAVTQGNYIVVASREEISKLKGIYYLEIWKYNQKYFLQTNFSKQQSKIQTGILMNVKISDDHTTIVASLGSDSLIMESTNIQIEPHSIKQYLKGHSGQISSIDISRDKEIIVTSSLDFTVKIWKLDGVFYYLHQEIVLIHEIQQLVISDDKSMLIGASSDETTIIWELNNKQMYSKNQILIGHKTAVKSVDISKDKKTIVTAAENQVRVWKINELNLYQINQVLEHAHHLKMVEISSDADQILSTTSDGTIVIWKAEKYTQCQRGALRVGKICLSPVLIIIIGAALFLIIIIMIRQRFIKQNSKNQNEELLINHSLQDSTILQNQAEQN